MLTIRFEQIDVLSEYSLAQFKSHMLDELRATYPAKTAELSRSGLLALVTRGIEGAEKYGIEDEADVRRYLHLLTRRGERFPSQDEEVARILDARGMSGTDKMDQIDQYELFVLDSPPSKKGPSR